MYQDHGLIKLLVNFLEIFAEVIHAVSAVPMKWPEN